MFRTLFLTCLFFSLGASVLTAQAYPVTAVVQTLPPFTTSLSDWTDPINNQLGATLLLNDREEPGFQVRLKVTIEGGGVLLRTNDNWVPRPITLTYGSATQLTAMELAEYFQLDHLDFFGISRQAYLDNGGLPEATYSVCIEVFDFDRANEEAASAKSCNFIQARLLDPPVITSPIGFQTPLTPQQLVVNWQARHTATFLTTYRVEIYPVPQDIQQTAEQIYASEQPYAWQEVDGVTLTTFEAGFTPLIAGSTYLLRVQALDPMGNNAFKNAGYSEPVFFEYGSDCPPPGGLNGSVNSFDAASVSWDFAQGAGSYVVRFREKNPNANWYEKVAVFNDANLTDLIDNTTYEVQVQSVCSSGGSGPFGPIFEFTTDTIPYDIDNFDCTTAVNDIPRPTNTNNIDNLEFGDSVKVAGGFNLRITSATPTSSGGWNGTGQVRVPWLFKNINCRFRNLFVNTTGEVYDGNVIAVDEGLSSLPGFKSVGEILAERDTMPLNFCGDSTGVASSPDTVDYVADFYAAGSESYSDHWIPFSSTAPHLQINEDLFFNEYNPNNPRKRYLPSDYSNPNNPYTPDTPYDPANTWNPWNAFNPYDHTDYTDPANPWTADFPWTADRMFQKQGTMAAANDDFLTTGGVSLPLQLGASPNMLAIYGIKFTPTGAFLNAYFSADIPLANQHTAFQTIGAGFTPNGLQGEVKLKMLTDVQFNWSNAMQLTIEKGNQTYVKFDCAGVNEVSVKMKVQLCREVAIPVDQYTYEPKDDEYVTGSFRAVAGGWGEFAGELSVSPFELTQLPGWAFSVQDVVFDLSETTTPASVSFPPGYDHDDVDPVTRSGRNSPKWRGFYMGAARVKIPDNLTGRDSTGQAPLTIGAQKLIIDQTGFTGDIYAVNVMSLDTGRLDAWALAIDSISLGIRQNQFGHTAFKGKVKVPVIDQALTYDCHVQPGSKYSFKIGLTDTITMNAFVAQARLDPNTTIGIDYRVVDKTFAASATLHGQITFGPQLGAPEDPGAGDPALGGAAAAANGGANAGAGQGQNSNATPQDTTNALRLPYIAFQDFELSSRAPYINNIGSWALGMEEQGGAAGFPITLNEVGMFQNVEQTEVAFGLDLSLNLVPTEDQGFAANGRAFIICDVAINQETKIQEWTFKRVRLDKLSLEYEGPGFEFRGYIQNFENNSVYGTGFQGGIQAGFTPGISVAVAALFGKVDGYRYFFADALLGLDPGIPLGASGRALYGFGGGVRYHMERQSFANISLPYSEAEEVGSAPDTLVVQNPALGGLEAAFQGGQDPLASVPPLIELPTEIGRSLSGVRYLPNENVGIGIKAMVAFGAIRREVFNGDITFEIIFNANGSLNYIGLAGNANFMTPPRTPVTPSPQPAISFYADLGYNFDAETFDAYLRLQVMAPPGLGYVRGSYPNAVAGTGEIHAGPDDWYFYIGTPNTPVSLSLDISKLANLVRNDGNGDEALPDPNITPLDSTSNSGPLGQIDAVGLILTAYLDAGTILPAFPPPPGRVTDILGDGNWDLVSRDDPAFANAEGLLFGASLQLNMPDLRFLVFYAELYAGAGFDMMLRNYGQNARCLNDLDNPEPIGFNGWYATGQLYGYLQGMVGIDVRLGSLKIKIPILDIGAAALLQARLPNPLWAQGTVAGRFSVLGGLIKGNCRFQFELGEPCEIVPGGNQDIQIIQSLVPADSTEAVSVFTRPQAIFNLPIGVATPLLDEFGDEPDAYVYVKPQISSFTVTDTETGAAIPGVLEWDDLKMVAAFRPNDILPGEKDFTLEVKVQILQRRADQADFQLMDAAGNIPPEQEMSVTFTTGPAPDYIPEDNVRYAYPINRQTSFFKEENGRGYVQLDQGQDYLFAVDASEWQQRILWHQNGQVVSATDYQYDTEQNELSFAIPAGSLNGATVSYLEVIDLPVGPDAAVTANIDSLQQDLAAGLVPENNDTEILLQTQQANGVIVGNKPRLLYHLDFRTSQYPTNNAKLAALTQDIVTFDVVPLTDTIDAQGNPIPFLSIDDFRLVMGTNEGFDRYDLEGFDLGVKDIAPLLRARANPNVTANNWYNNFPKPMVYDQFPQTGAPFHFDLDWRTAGEPYELPPLNAVEVRENSLLPLRFLTDQNINSATYTVGQEPINLRYHLPYLIYRDYSDFWNQAILYVGSGADIPDWLEQFLQWDFVLPNSGIYEVKLEYYLPGKETPNSSFAYPMPYNR